MDRALSGAYGDGRNSYRSITQLDRLNQVLSADEVNVEYLRTLVREHGIPEESNLRAVIWKVRARRGCDGHAGALDR